MINPNNLQKIKYFYKKYTFSIISLEKHIVRMYDDLIIDIHMKNLVLHKLDRMVKSMINVYNNYIYQLHKENEQIDINDPFQEIKLELVKLIEENGISSMNKFFKLFIGDKYHNLLDTTILEIFDLYNEVFIPVGMSITKIESEENNNDPFAKKIESKCDALIDNTCLITLRISNMSLKIIFDGYIRTDTLNVNIRSSQICSKYLFDIREEADKIVAKECPQIDNQFLTNYHKLNNSCCYFINDADTLSKKIIADYLALDRLNNQSFNSIVSEFTLADLKHMFRMINLLLMGNKENVCTAGLLFKLIKSTKHIYRLSDIIYKNLSYCSQIKLADYKKI